MKVIVIGLGSMGKRRIRLMKQYDSKLDIIGVDTNEERLKLAEEEFGIRTSSSIDEICNAEKIDCAFVCTSPLSHHNIIKSLIQYKLHVFTEINLVADGYEEFIKTDSVKLFLSSTFLYRKDIQWMINEVHNEQVNYIYHTGQYLPDWHPWENYQQFFVGDKRTNGCREIFAIELPWLVACFGKIKHMNVIKNKMTELQIDYPDNYLLQIEHENGNKGLLAVDVVARKAIRRMEIYSESLQIYWDGTPNSLQRWDYDNGQMESVATYDNIVKDKNYCDNIIENAYMDEIDAFFSWIKGDNSKVRHNFSKDLEILNIIDKIEE